MAIGMIAVGFSNGTLDGTLETTTEPTTTVVQTTEVATTKATTQPTTEVTTKTQTTEPVTTTQTTKAKSTETFKLTAYCGCAKCCGKTDGITATGTKATQGRTIAVDPRVIPYGTKVVINGNTYIAEDCGGAIKGNRIDIYFDSHNEALQFGVKYADVHIVGS